MRTAIKSLEIIKEMYEYFVKKYRDLEPNLMICEKEDFDNVEKHLKALEIIKEKPIVALVDYKYTYEEWLELVDEKDKDLFKNKEEYDLLKEVLE